MPCSIKKKLRKYDVVGWFNTGVRMRLTTRNSKSEAIAAEVQLKLSGKIVGLVRTEIVRRTYVPA